MLALSYMTAVILAGARISVAGILLSRAAGEGRNGFAGIGRLSGCRRRRPVPQFPGIMPGGCILGVALKNPLKLFERIVKLLLFVQGDAQIRARRD